jgi:hypothetical protein
MAFQKPYLRQIGFQEPAISQKRLIFEVLPSFQKSHTHRHFADSHLSGCMPGGRKDG